MLPETADILALKASLSERLSRTPVLRCAALEAELGGACTVHAKMEFLQRTGTFKARGALTAMLGLTESERRRGVTAVSAGNHAVAVAYAAQAFGVTAKVVMLRTSNPARVERCRSFGAEILFADDVHAAFAVVERLQRDEQRVLVHPFEGPHVVRGTATLGLELLEQLPHLDAVVVPIGGGGLCAGVAAMVKQQRPDCAVYGVEPVGAASMHLSFDQGAPASIERVSTIADSLGAPHAMPMSFDLCRRFVDRLVLIDDDDLRAAMRFLFRDMKMAVEPACAASTAAACGPLRDELRGKKAALILCGSNIDWSTYAEQTFRT